MALAKNLQVYGELGEALTEQEKWLRQDFKKQRNVVAVVVAKMKGRIEDACNDETDDPKRLFMEINRLNHRVQEVMREQGGDNLSPAERGLRFSHELRGDPLKKEDKEEEEVQGPKMTNRIALNLPGAPPDLMQSKKLVGFLERLRKKGRNPQTVFNGRCQADGRGMFLLVNPEDLINFDVAAWQKMKPGQRIAALESALSTIAGRA